MTRLPFRRVAVDPQASDLPFTRTFLERLGGAVPVEIGPPPRGKSALYVTLRKGPFLKECPCTPGALQCGYKVFTPAFGCPYSCSYCFLEFYAPEEPLTVYANLADAEDELRAAAKVLSGPIRVGTGEFADSLALEPWTGHGALLAGIVRDLPNIILELKTKSGDPAPLLNLPPLPNLVAAWSLNPVSIAVREERLAAPVAERIKAAAAVAASGRFVAFHFDPIMAVPSWREDYATLLDELFSGVDSSMIRWISLGTLRFPRRFIEENGPNLRGNPVFFAEFARGLDGKMRYPWFDRRDIYRFMAEGIRQRAKTAPPVYLCMEPPQMWRAVFGHEPAEGEVKRLLCRAGEKE